MGRIWQILWQTECGTNLHCQSRKLSTWQPQLCRCCFFKDMPHAYRTASNGRQRRIFSAWDVCHRTLCVLQSCHWQRWNRHEDRGERRNGETDRLGTRECPNAEDCQLTHGKNPQLIPFRPNFWRLSHVTARGPGVGFDAAAAEGDILGTPWWGNPLKLIGGMSNMSRIFHAYIFSGLQWAYRLQNLLKLHD